MNHRQLAERFIGSVVQASAPAVSPDGTQIAFVVSRVDISANTTTSQVWLADTPGTPGTPDATSQAAPRPVTNGEHDGQPAWSPDGTALAFTAKRGDTDDKTTLHVMPIGAGGEVRTIATMADGISDVRFSPDGSQIAFTSRTRHERYDAKDEQSQAPRKIERFFGRLDNEGWIGDRPSHVYLVAVDGTGATRNLTPGEFQHHGVSWMPDGTGIVTSAQRHDSWDLDFAVDLYRISVDGNSDTDAVGLTQQTGSFTLPSASPDGGRIAFIGYDDPSTFPQNDHVGIVALDATGSAGTAAGHEFVSRGLDRTFATSAGSRAPVWESATTLLATAEDRGETHLYRVHLDGTAPQRLTSGAITVRTFDHAGGTIAATVGSVDGVADVFVLGADGLIRVTDFAARYRDANALQTWERFAVPSTDGTVEIDAWVMRPAGFDPGERYPVLLNVHGGPHTQYCEGFFDEAQMQAAAGFVVVMCNPRGGSGREESWGQSILGPRHPVRPGAGWGTADVDDVLAVLDHVLDHHAYCDRDRVGMLGGSYGGFMATWLAAKHGSRFRAVCSERAVNNLLSVEWTSDVGSMFRVEIGPSHLDDPDAYTSISPIQWAADIHVPMLLIHSENDLRCPIGQAEELFMALRLRGRDVTFYRFPGESHELSRTGSPLHRVQRAEIILDYFAERLAAR